MKILSFLWTPHFWILDSACSILDSTFWLGSTLKIRPERQNQTDPVFEPRFWSITWSNMATQHLKTGAHNLSLFQFYMLDIFLFISLSVLVFCAISTMCICWLCKRASRCLESRNKLKISWCIYYISYKPILPTFYCITCALIFWNNSFFHCCYAKLYMLHLSLIK